MGFFHRRSGSLSISVKSVLQCCFVVLGSNSTSIIPPPSMGIRSGISLVFVCWDCVLISYIYMPLLNKYAVCRISLYKPEKDPDYTFLDKNINECSLLVNRMFMFTSILGPRNPDDPEPRISFSHDPSETNIQDLLFLENRDRKYDESIYRLRGIYNVQDVDFDMSQFGLFLQNDTLFMTIPISYSVKTLGRKVMPWRCI